MFDLYTGNVSHMPQKTAWSILALSGLETMAVAVLALMSFLVATRELPAVPDVLAFVAELPAAVPPPPPPPPKVATAQPQLPPPDPAAAPVEAPTEIAPEPIALASDFAGVEGGVVSGVVGGVPALEVPPPPPPPAKAEPVRIGGQVSAPALVRKVDPVYPSIAQLASIDGIVILDAIVDESGRVTSVKVLRGHPLLAKAATEAVEQWQYEPLKLNGTPTAFQLTVSLWFHFDDKKKKS